MASFIFGSWFLLNGQYALAIMAASLSGSLMAFLRFNFSRTSKIFMGDTGSLILGFVLTIFAVKFIHFNTSAGALLDAPILAICVLIVPIFDTLRIFIYRMAQGRSPMAADKNHFHHLLLAQGFNHFQATLLLCTFTLATSSFFLLIRNHITTTQGLALLMLLFVVYFIVGLWMARRTDYTDPSQAQQPPKVAPKKVLA